MRTTPKDAPPAVGQLTRTDDVRTYRFLTPVFGGGVAAKESDPVTPVRVASIRGQLRFWWRAVNPRGCTTVTDLRQAEVAVFGSTDERSPLVVRVTKQAAKPAAVSVFRDGTPFGVEGQKGRGSIAYGAFPLRATDAPFRHGKLAEFGDDPFELALSYCNDIKLDVHAALWAWAHFGGLGGRIRRGFGAIAQVSPEIPSIDQDWPRLVYSRSVPWPHLERSPVFAAGESRTNDGVSALALMLSALAKIRQGSSVGRRAGQGKTPGRSFWPEPDAIRRAFPGQVGEKHRMAVTTDNSFPRAAFGTPIQFHFKDGGNGDPDKTTLRPSGSQRLASRLILRPHLAANGRVEAMALVLAHPTPAEGYVLVQGDGPGKPVAVQLKKPLSLGDGSAFVDPIERFLEELRK